MYILVKFSRDDGSDKFSHHFLEPEVFGDVKFALSRMSSYIGIDIDMGNEIRVIDNNNCSNVFVCDDIDYSVLVMSSEFDSRYIELHSSLTDIVEECKIKYRSNKIDTILNKKL